MKYIIVVYYTIFGNVQIYNDNFMYFLNLERCEYVAHNAELDEFKYIESNLKIDKEITVDMFCKRVL